MVFILGVGVDDIGYEGIFFGVGMVYILICIVVIWVCKYIKFY